MDKQFSEMDNTSIGLSGGLFSCKSKKMTVNPGAQVSIDGTKDGLQHIQRDFEGAAVIEQGIMVTFDSDVLFPLNSSYLTLGPPHRRDLPLFIRPARRAF